MSTPVSPRPDIRALACPNCGGTIELRGMGRTLSVVCIQCLTVLDPTVPGLKILQQFQAKQRFRPLIPLGTRGKLHGDPYEVIGFQVRQFEVEGKPYRWSEYVLFNPYKGFRYLTESEGHWNDVKTIHSLPEIRQSSGQPVAKLLGETYKHFQKYEAETIFVMGEFPWRVEVGEKVSCDDYVHPPRILSSERTGAEVVWSVGEYTPGETIWRSFALSGKPPAPLGVFANQPSPHAGKLREVWSRFFFWMLVLFAVQIVWVLLHANQEVFSQRYSYTQRTLADQEASFVTDIFELRGRTSNVEVEIQTDLDNNWAYFNMALINADTGNAYDFSREVSYYHGRDSDGSWSEGSPSKSVVLSSVPSGRYYLRIEPEMDDSNVSASARSMNYRIRVRRDVTTWAFFWIGVALLLIPPILRTLRSWSFETKRWAESDYPPGE